MSISTVLRLRVTAYIGRLRVTAYIGRLRGTASVTVTRIGLLPVG